MGWETDWEKDMEKDLEQSNDMESVTSDSMEKFDDNFFDDFFEEETDETGGAKVLKLSKTKGDRSVSHRDLEADAEGMRALNEFYMESANEIYDNMKAISEDSTLSPVEKLEKMQYESRRWEICKREWEKDANGKK